MTSTNNPTVELAVARVMSNYATGLDTKQWPLVRQCFSDQVLINYGAISAPSGPNDSPRAADGWLEVLQTNLRGFHVTQHTITNHRVSVEAARVRCVSYLIAEHFLFNDPALPLADESQYITVGGYYENVFELAGEQWTICESELAVRWMRGNFALFEIAASRAG